MNILNAKMQSFCAKLQRPIFVFLRRFQLQTHGLHYMKITVFLKQRDKFYRKEC